MFNTNEIARRIKQARIDKNMTQMNLAEAMGVSYQAVSSWERGNAMPDISKLEDLCRILDISVEALLGMETKAAAAVHQVLQEEPLSVEELVEVAPILPPEQVKEKTEESRKRKKLKLSAIAELAPFLGEDYLDELLQDVDPEDLEGLEDVAPFLSQKTLNDLADRVTPENLEVLVEAAPFFSKEALDKLVRKCEDVSDFDSLEELAPFLSRETLDGLVERSVEKGEYDSLEELYPFLSKDTLRKLAKKLMEEQELDALEDIMPFV